MARTISEISDELKSNFVTNPTIQQFYGITPGNTFAQEFSIVSFESVLLYIIAVSLWMLESNFDLVKIEVEQKVDSNRRWSTPVIVEDAKSFQYGDSLEWIDGQYKYATDNPSSKIVSLAAAQEIGNSIVLKVAKSDGSGNIQELPATELEAFSVYMVRMFAPGTNYLIVSRPADTLKIYYRVYIDPLVMDLTGALLSDPSVKPVEAAIDLYCKSLKFAGVFDVTELTDQIQTAHGVKRPVFLEGYAKYGLTAYAQFQDFYIPNAGYLEIDPAFPLENTITYLQMP